MKLHPLLRVSATERITAPCERYDSIEITNTSIHDIVRASDFIVSQNSAVGFEALMHGKPVISCGRCDYHHATLVSRNEKELRKNLAVTEAHFGGFPFEKYFYWFLGLKMLEPQKEGFADKAMSILQVPQASYDQVLQPI